MCFVIHAELIRIKSKVLLQAISSIVWTSGTTGRPKGIKRRYRQMVEYLRPSKRMAGVDVLQTTCFFHGGGFIGPVVRESSRTYSYEIKH